MWPFNVFKWRGFGALAVAALLSFAAAQSVQDVQKLPLLHDPNLPTPRQVLGGAERAEVQALINTLNARVEIKGISGKWEYFKGLALKDVLFTLVAPYRSSTPERLTVFTVYEGEPPVFLFVLSGSGKLTAEVVEPLGNMGLCMVREGHTLRDINADGKREVVLVTACGDGPGGGSTINFFAYGKTGWQAWGSTRLTRTFNASPEFSEESNQLYVKKGQNYQLYAVRTFHARSENDAEEEGVAMVKIYLRPQSSPYKARKLF